MMETLAIASNVDPGWTADRVEILKTEWLAGRSCSQIARTLGGGITRNAVIGKVHRLKLDLRRQKPAPPRTERPRPDQPPRKVAAFNVPRAHKRVKPPLPDALDGITAGSKPMPDIIVDHDIVGIPLIELTDKTCKWPIGDPLEPGFRFCGHQSEEGKPYCERHGKRAWAPIPQRSRVAA